jgi:hypothetical protein
LEISNNIPIDLTLTDNLSLDLTITDNIPINIDVSDDKPLEVNVFDSIPLEINIVENAPKGSTIFYKIVSQTKKDGYTQTSTLENNKVYTYIRDEDNIVIETVVI